MPLGPEGEGLIKAEERRNIHSRGRRRRSSSEKTQMRIMSQYLLTKGVSWEEAGKKRSGLKGTRRGIV